MSDGNLWFPDVPKQLNEMYDFISKVVTDIKNLKRELSQKELKKLVDDFKNGVETINLICIKIVAEYEVAKRTNREIHISPAERREIRRKIEDLTYGLNMIFDTEPMQNFLKKNSKLAKKAYMKLYQEGVPDGPEPEPTEDEAHAEFLSWIRAIVFYNDALLVELEKEIKKSL